VGGRIRNRSGGGQENFRGWALRIWPDRFADRGVVFFDASVSLSPCSTRWQQKCIRGRGNGLAIFAKLIGGNFLGPSSLRPSQGCPHTRLNDHVTTRESTGNNATRILAMIGSHAHGTAETNQSPRLRMPASCSHWFSLRWVGLGS